MRATSLASATAGCTRANLLAGVQAHWRKRYVRIWPGRITCSATQSDATGTRHSEGLDVTLLSSRDPPPTLTSQSSIRIETSDEVLELRLPVPKTTVRDRVRGLKGGAAATSTATQETSPTMKVWVDAVREAQRTSNTAATLTWLEINGWLLTCAGAVTVKADVWSGCAGRDVITGSKCVW